ncbi:MAG TPA: YibE/F family protein [Acidimicrobiales bacterium]|nr:YibE/F family protein [Acidimicrobiales bacterium]
MRGHRHTEPAARLPVPRRVSVSLGLAVGAGFVAALVGMVLLWPPHAHVGGAPGYVETTPTVTATVVVTRVYDCAPGGVLPGGAPSTPVRCETSQVALTSGRHRGDVVPVDTDTGAASTVLHSGDHVVLAVSQGPTGTVYEFFDYQRHTSLLVLGLVFAVVVVAVARWRGLGAIAGLVVTWGVLSRFTFPALLEGRDAFAVALVTSALVICVVLFVAHGVNARTSTAVLGTLASLALVGALGVAAVHFTHLTGLGSEDVAYLKVASARVHLDGLLLAGMVIGSLGVLNDVTVTQASAVWEIHDANPSRGALAIYRAGMRVGRDHIASTIYTLILAYAGAALPLLLLFDLGGRAFSNVVSSETIAEEVVRTLVGSVGLVASVPLTTGLAAAVVTAASRHERNDAPREGDAVPDL